MKTHFHRKDDSQIYAEDVPLSVLAKEFGTPSYIYCLSTIKAQYETLSSTFAEILPKDRQPLLCYACKANSNKAILSALRSWGAGLEIVSGNELVRGVNAGFDPRVLTEGRVDILAVFKSNEPDTIRRLGFELNTWEPEDYGVPMLGLTYITLEDFSKSNPDIVERFLKATLKATKFSMENPKEALDVVMEFAPNESREHQEFMLGTELSDSTSATTDKYGLGWMTSTQWEDLYNHLLEFEALPKPFDYSSAYDDRYLRSIYEEGELVWP
mgnify:CR=1 FL=1